MADKWWREFQIQTDTSVSHPPPLPPLYPGTHLPHLFSGHLSPRHPASLPAALSPAPPVTSIASPPFIPRPRPLRASRLGSARSPEASLPPCSLLTSLQRVGHTVCPHTLGAMGPSSPWHPPSLASPHPPPGSFLGDSPMPTSLLLCAQLPPQLLTPHTPLLGHQLPPLLAQVSVLSSSLPPCSPLRKATCPRHPPMPHGGLS